VEQAAGVDISFQRPSRLAPRAPNYVVRFAAAFEKTWVTAVPTDFTAVAATRAIRTRSNAYSVRSWPCSSCHRRLIRFCMSSPPDLDKISGNSGPQPLGLVKADQAPISNADRYAQSNNKACIYIYMDRHASDAPFACLKCLGKRYGLMTCSSGGFYGLVTFDSEVRHENGHTVCAKGSKRRNSGARRVAGSLSCIWSRTG